MTQKIILDKHLQRSLEELVLFIDPMDADFNNIKTHIDKLKSKYALYSESKFLNLDALNQLKTDLDSMKSSIHSNSIKEKIQHIIKWINPSIEHLGIEKNKKKSLSSSTHKEPPDSLDADEKKSLPHFTHRKPSRSLDDDEEPYHPLPPSTFRKSSDSLDDDKETHQTTAKLFSLLPCSESKNLSAPVSRVSESQISSHISSSQIIASTSQLPRSETSSSTSTNSAADNTSSSGLQDTDKTHKKQQLK